MTLRSLSFGIALFLSTTLVADIYGQTSIVWGKDFPKTSTTTGAIQCGGTITLGGGWNYADATPKVLIRAWQSGSFETTAKLSIDNTGTFIGYVMGLTPGATYNVRAEVRVSNGTIQTIATEVRTAKAGS
jgi:hypothetical protein